MSDAERLRDAATRLRAVAGAALAETGGSWHAAGGPGYVIHVDTMHPGVALALADWLDVEADLHDMHHDVYGVGDRIDALVDAVLGGEQS